MSDDGIETRWGANLNADGRAVFRLWAPKVERLRLSLGTVGERAMKPCGDGWFSLEADDLPDGTAYQFILPDGMAVPDPASRAQAGDVHSPSLLTRSAFDWRTTDWTGRPWEEAVIYELHPGTFAPQGSFAGVRRRLDHLADIGVTAIELMPVAQFSGKRGWGYDGVLPYCPHAAYGGIGGLKRLVDAAHARGLMILLDVVYNHFGPDGNYLHAYAPDFFDDGDHTPWGPAIRFEVPAVRDFFVGNALYWLEEFRLDGLRFDAIDQIRDRGREPILEEIARCVRERFVDRHVHLVSEDERNVVALHPRDAENRPTLLTAEWNDDVHHAAHCIATGEAGGYYAAFVNDPAGCLARSLAEGFCYQGEAYGPWENRPRGVPSAGQPPAAFVDFLQNHDQIGNRAFGERLTELADEETVELLTAVLLLNPQIPLLFMGEEYGETNPFLFFTDFHGDLAQAVREGRRREFSAFEQFAGKKAERIPDPNAPATFEASMLDWQRAESEAGRRRLALFRRLLEIRRTHIVPHLPAMRAMQGHVRRWGERAFAVRWETRDGELFLATNLGSEDAETGEAPPGGYGTIYESREGLRAALGARRMPARAVAVLTTAQGDGDDAR